MVLGSRREFICLRNHMSPRVRRARAMFPSPHPSPLSHPLLSPAEHGTSGQTVLVITMSHGSKCKCMNCYTPAVRRDYHHMIDRRQTFCVPLQLHRIAIVSGMAAAMLLDGQTLHFMDLSFYCLNIRALESQEGGRKFLGKD